MPHGLKIEHFGTEFDAGPEAFFDSAALMENLDLIITADTAIAHLSGALARPTWVAIKHVPDWRWRSAGNTTPWYPTLRLFRQTAREDWRSVYAQIENELPLLLESGSST